MNKYLFFGRSTPLFIPVALLTRNSNFILKHQRPYASEMTPPRMLSYALADYLQAPANYVRILWTAPYSVGSVISFVRLTPLFED
jgi:hypothetical protein